jgi:NAD(P)-dependent dehydrogenase (short-subunit alcohol dehydrogenase family)
LGEARATVYVTARPAGQGARDATGSLAQTVDEVKSLGGKCIAIPCDHREDTQVKSVFEQISREQGRLDILVNSVWGGYENMSENGEFTWSNPFWEQPLWRWEAMFRGGVRAHFVSSQYAAPIMIRQKSGLIVNISFWAAQKYMGNAIYGASKAATDKFSSDMAEELRKHSVAVVSLYPGLVRTERIMQAKEFFDLSNSESPQFVGRAVAALASDPNLMQKTGKVLLAAQLAREYGFSDIDGKLPKPLSLETS